MAAQRISSSAPQMHNRTSTIFQYFLAARYLVTSVSSGQKAKMRQKAHLFRSATGPVRHSITPGPPKGDPLPASVVQGVIQRNFRVQYLRNRAARFGFIDDLVEGRLINAWQRDGAGQCHFGDGKAVAFLSSDTSAVVSMLSGG